MNTNMSPTFIGFTSLLKLLSPARVQWTGTIEDMVSHLLTILSEKKEIKEGRRKGQEERRSSEIENRRKKRKEKKEIRQKTKKSITVAT